MLKTTIRYLLIALGLISLGIATSPDAMDAVWTKRRGDKWWESSGWKNGDLVGMAHLDLVKKFVSPSRHHVLKPPVYNGTKNAVLYICGDSYAQSAQYADFAGIAAFHSISRYAGGFYHLDTSKNNILIIEVSEFWIRDYFEGPRMINEVYDPTTKDNKISLNALSDMRPYYGSFPFHFTAGFFFNKRINQNLERLIFHFNCIMPMFQTKAMLNYYAFNRASGNVVISKNGDFLFDNGSVSKLDNGIYAPIKDDYIDHVVYVLNNLYDHYSKEGFKAVYISLIPSTPSIIAAEGYNQLIPRIQNNPNLRMKVIDMYSEFSGRGELYFCHGDAHWNANGEQKWIDKVNEILINNQTR